jgi:hypothetical protein
MIIDIFKTSIYKTSLENKEYIDYFCDIIDEQKKLNNLTEQHKPLILLGLFCKHD